MDELTYRGPAAGHSHLGVDQNWSSANVIDLAIRLALLGLIIYLAVLVVSPLFGIIMWSVVLAVALYPVFDWLAAATGGRRKLAAAIFTIIAILVVLGPVTWLAISLVENLQGVWRSIESGRLPVSLPVARVKEWILIGPKLADLLELASTNFAAAFGRVAPTLRPLGSTLLNAAGIASTSILAFVAAILIAGFLFPSGPALADGVKRFARRVITRRGSEFVELAASTIRKVSRGIIGVAGLQAVLAGFGMVVAHIPAAGFLTFLVLVLGIVQVGPGLVLLPLIVWSWFQMETTAALLFTAYIVPVSLLDNVLRPIVMGRGLGTPMPVAFAGLIGGVLTYGVIGVFIGPVVLAIAWGLLVAWINDAERAGSAEGL